MWKEGQWYTVFGVLLLGAVLYLNFYDGEIRNGIRIPIPWLQPTMGFVYRNGTQFFVDDGGGGERSCSGSMCQPVYVNGWNSYWLLQASATGEEAKVSEMLTRGREMGMGLCRTWAFSDGEGGLQIEPGRFDERTFRALDYVIYEARRKGVRLILSLVNNLNEYGGKAKYVEWARKAGANVSDSGDAFFSDPTIKGYYKDYVKSILARKNSYSGIKYTDEPAIFAWELMNEPRCVSNSSTTVFQAWISEMASYVKHLDKKHLVTVGLEGFYGAKRSEKLMANPGDWAASFCSDFIQNSAIKHIDFASVHAYPDSWLPHAHLEDKAKYLAKWVDSHINDSEYILKKPVLFTEVGSSQLHANNKQGLYGKDILLKTVYDKIYESAQKGQAGAGAFIWQLLVDGTEQYEDEFSLVVKEHRTAYILIMQSCRLHYTLRKGELNRTVGWPCVGIKF